MAGYRASQTITVWKQHECVACTSRYRYLFERKLQGQGGTAQAAEENLGKVIQNALANDVDYQPCPQCGTYQPDMTAQRERSRLFWLFLTTPIVGLILIIIGASGGGPPSTMLWVTTAFAAAMAAWFYLLETKNPNADLRGNQNKAQKGINAGKLILDQAKPGFEPGRHPTGGGMNTTTLGLLAAAVVIMPCAELIRTAGGWPLNPDFHWPVVGPGDTTRIEGFGSVASLKGHWAGKPTVTVLNASEIGSSTPFTAASRAASWGNNISFKSSEKASTARPWVDITVPNEPALAGKSVQLKTMVAVTFPRLMTSTSFSTGYSSFERTAILVLAPPGAGSKYATIWGTTLTLGILIITTLAVLAWRAAKKASRNTQTQLIPLQPNPPAA